MNTRRVPEDRALEDQFGALEAAGVTWVTMGLPTKSRGAYLDELARFAERFLPDRG